MSHLSLSLISRTEVSVRARFSHHSFCASLTIITEYLQARGIVSLPQPGGSLSQSLANSASRKNAGSTVGVLEEQQGVQEGSMAASSDSETDSKEARVNLAFPIGVKSLLSLSGYRA